MAISCFIKLIGGGFVWQGVMYAFAVIVMLPYFRRYAAWLLISLVAQCYHTFAVTRLDCLQTSAIAVR